MTLAATVEKSRLWQAKTWGNYGGFKHHELDVLFRGQEGVYRGEESIRRGFPLNGQGQPGTWFVAIAQGTAATAVWAAPLAESSSLERCESAFRVSQALKNQPDIAWTRITPRLSNDQTSAFD
jgi:hypothetical protein